LKQINFITGGSLAIDPP